MHFGYASLLAGFLQDSICIELVQRIREHAPVLQCATAVAAEVDCLVALALSANQYHFCRPQLTPDNVLHIRQGTPLDICRSDTPDVLVLSSSPCTWHKLI